MDGLDERALKAIEDKHRSGLTSADILDVFATHGVRLSEATLRKYVQLGLLPRSVRMGKKGKHQGSQGIYPVRVVRQIVQIKRMMAESFTIEQIQKEVLFMRGEIEQLEQTLETIFSKIDSVVKAKRGSAVARSVAREVTGARALSRDLLARLLYIESKLTEREVLERVVAS